MGAYTVTGQRARQMRVVPADVLKRLYTRSDRYGLAQTAAHLALLVAGGWLVLETRDTWWVVPALVLQGIFVNALFGAMHESVHYGSFRTRWMANLLAFLSGAAILNNAGFYRHYHMAHHRYTQDPERDPELVTSGTPRTWGQYLLRVSSIPFLMLRLRDIFLFPFGYRGNVDYIHPSAWPEARRWGRWLLALYAMLATGSIALQTTVVLWVWFIPLLVGLPFLRLYLMCEHTLCPNSDDGFANTRTTLSNPVVRFLMWNLPYHAEHHLFPNIAFHNLPEAHRHLRPHLKYVAKGYIQVQGEIVRVWRETSRVRTSEGVFECGDVSLQRGGTLKAARIVYKTFGTLSAARDNVIVYPTSYSAHHTDIEWLVDPVHCLDPSRYFIVIPNMFTNGLSSSPSNTPGEFPEVTTFDNVTQQRRLMAELFGVDRVKMVYGWSMGAQQAYHWAALFGAAVERIVVNCGSARTAPHNFVFLEGVRSAAQAARTPSEGLRAMGRIYAGWALSQTFYRCEMWRGLGFTSLEDFLVRSWEANFLRRDARDLMAQLWTWQNGDIAANDLYRGDLQMALAGIKAKVLLMPSATDLYFQTDDNRAELPHLARGRLAEIPSIWGHRAGNPNGNPRDAAFIDKAVEALLAE